MVGTIMGMLIKTSITEEVAPATAYSAAVSTTTTTAPFAVVGPVMGLAIDLGLGLIPPKLHWQKAFLNADRAALQPFFAAFPGPMGSGKKKKKKIVAKPAGEEESADEEKAAPAKAASARSTPAKTAPAKAAPAKKEAPAEEEDLGLGVDE